MKKLILLIFALSSSVIGQVNIGWIANTAGVSIAVDNYNNVYTVYYEYNPGGDIYLTKRNSSGQFQWQVSYDQTDLTKWEKATWVETDNIGNIVVTGTLMSGYSNPVVAASIVMKFNSNGTLLWRHVYESSFDGSQTTKCLIDEDNNIYILGTGINGSSGMNLKVKKLAPEGTHIWTYFNAIGMPLNMKFTPDNGIIVIGRSIYGSVNGFAKLDKNGNPIWTMTGIYSQTIGDAAGDEFGNTYIINHEYEFNSENSILKKINPFGSEIWSVSYVIAALRVEVGNDNMPVIVGYPSMGSFGSSFVKFNPSGIVVWANMDADSTYNLLSHSMVKMDNLNNVYLAAGTMTEMAVCKVMNNGNSGWTITAPGGYAYALDIGYDYSIYAVGGNTLGNTIQILQTLTSISGKQNIVSNSYWLSDNYPNPFNPVTKIDFEIPKQGFISLKVFDLLGKEVKSLVNEVKAPGIYTVQFNGSELSSGVYFYRLETNGFTDIKKMMLIK